MTIMTDPNSRHLQQLLEAADYLLPLEATSESEDMEYEEPTTEDGDEEGEDVEGEGEEEAEALSHEEFIRRLLSGDEDDDGMGGN